MNTCTSTLSLHIHMYMYMYIVIAHTHVRVPPSMHHRVECVRGILQSGGGRRSNDGVRLEYCAPGIRERYYNCMCK